MQIRHPSKVYVYRHTKGGGEIQPFDRLPSGLSLRVEDRVVSGVEPPAGGRMITSAQERIQGQKAIVKMRNWGQSWK